ncbi:MAG: ABC transporter permease [Terriglobia bacterium]
MTQASGIQGFWLAVGTLWWRELLRFYRYRSRVLGALGTPVVFWFLIGSGVGRSFRPSTVPAGVDYLEYFYPGALILILLFTSIFCMMSIIEDRHEGFLLSVLVAPVARSSMVLGKILGGTTLSLLQGLVFVALAPAAGIALRPLQILLLAGVLFLIAFGLTGLGFLLAWKLDSVPGFHAVANLFLLPMWLLSGALSPSPDASPWVGWVMKVNPLTYAMAALRQVLYLDAPHLAGEGLSLALSLQVTVAFGLLIAVAAFWVAGRAVPGDWS